MPAVRQGCELQQSANNLVGNAALHDHSSAWPIGVEREGEVIEPEARPVSGHNLLTSADEFEPSVRLRPGLFPRPSHVAPIGKQDERRSSVSPRATIPDGIKPPLVGHFCGTEKLGNDLRRHIFDVDPVVAHD
jgi:hypothetical protein